jgi:CRISPR-associated protein Cas2
MNLDGKTSYLITYDVCDAKRLGCVYRALKGFGAHLQLSVFRCELSARQFIEMKTALLAEIKTTEDQVLIVDLGPAAGRGDTAISSLGRKYEKAGKQAIVI